MRVQLPSSLFLLSAVAFATPLLARAQEPAPAPAPTVPLTRQYKPKNLDGTAAEDDAPAGGGARGRRGAAAPGDKPAAPDKTAYDYELPGPDGKGVPLSSFKGKTLLVVNLGSKSSYNSQLPALEKLAEQYRDQGLVVIGVPSNEFGAAEPETDPEIQKLYVKDGRITFPVMAKSVLTGEEQLPLFQFLAKAEGGPVHWNYTKFFIDKTGKPIARFDAAVAPDSAEMQAAVVAILAGRYKAPGTGDAAPTGRRGGAGGAPPAN